MLAMQPCRGFGGARWAPASLASLGSQTLWPSNCAGRGAQLRPCASGASATPVLLPAPSGCSQARQADGDLANRSPWHPSTSPNDSALRGNIPGAKGGPRQVRPCCPPQSRRQVLSWTGRKAPARSWQGGAEAGDGRSSAFDRRGTLVTDHPRSTVDVRTEQMPSSTSR